MDARELEASGPYDPAAPDAHERLEVLAEPGQVLLDADTAAELGSDRVGALGPRAVAGFDDPVAVYALTR